MAHSCGTGSGGPTGVTAERGAALLLTFLMMLVLSGLALAAGVSGHNSLIGGWGHLGDQQAFYISEAGWQRARQALVAGTWTAALAPGNTYSEPFGDGAYQVTIVDNANGTYTLTADGYVPSQAQAAARRRLIESNVPATVGFPNLALAATADASGWQGGNLPANANDDSLGTRWECNAVSNCWLRLDFGAATTLDRVILQEQGARIVTTPAIEHSADTSSWTAVSGASVSTSGNTVWTISFTATPPRRYVRAVLALSSQRPRIREFEAYHMAVGPSVTLGNGSVTTQW